MAASANANVIPPSPATSPAKKPASKGKKTPCKFAFAKRAVVGGKAAAGHYITVCEMRGNFVITFCLQVSKSGSHVEPFTKFLKEYIDTGLSDFKNSANSEHAKFVRDTHLVMMCPRRGKDGKVLNQHPEKPYPWFQYVHRLPDSVIDSAKMRADIQKKMTNLMNKVSEKRSEFHVIYSRGMDFTPGDDLKSMDHRMLDKDVAELVLAHYDIQTTERVKEFAGTSDFEDFFTSETKGIEELQAAIQLMEDSGAYAAHFTTGCD